MVITNDYATYLHIDQLLELQEPLTPQAADEMLFIVVHQAYELWFKLILNELERAANALAAGNPDLALTPLRRVTATEEILIAQLRLLETMSPDGFLVFRDPLAPASGFQSEQFRQIENGASQAVWSGLCAALTAAGLTTGDDPGARQTALTDLYREHHQAPRAALHQVCELLVDHDEGLARWRYHHALMAAREIGRRPGTGGSGGVKYLETTLSSRLYPELWTVRSLL